MAPRFEIHKDIAGEYQAHLRAANGRIVMQSEGFQRKENLLHMIEAVKRMSPIAEIKDLTND